MRKSRGGSKKDSGVDLENLSDDDIDNFYNQREKQMTNLSGSLGKKYHDDDDDGILGAADDMEEVMGLNGLDEEEDEDEEGEEGEEEEEEDEFSTARAAWGNKRVAYYDERRDGEGELEGEAAEEEEKEARRLQKLQAVDMDADDFESLIARGKADEKRGGKALTDVESKMMKSMDDDLAKIKLGGSTTSKKTRDDEEDMEDVEEEEEVEKNLDVLSKEEKLRIIGEESPELVGLLEEFKTHSMEIELLQPLVEKVKEKPSPNTAEGGKLLQYKYSLLLQYCMYVAFYLRLKAHRVSVKDHPVIEELLRLREILENLKPLEHKLRFQIALIMGDKEAFDEVSLASQQHMSDGEDEDEGFDDEEEEEEEEEDKEEEDEMNDDEENEESEDEEGAMPTGVYRALKGMDDEGEEDDYEEERSTSKLSAARRRALTQTINAISQSSRSAAQKRDKLMTSGDQDIALPDYTKARKRAEEHAVSLKQAREQMKRESAAKKAKSEEQQSKEQGLSKRQEARRRQELAKMAKEELPEGSKRELSYKISKNKGLVRERSTKYGTTSHSRMRSKYQKKLNKARIRVGGTPRDATDAYEGESSGIHPRVVRSTKF